MGYLRITSTSPHADDMLPSQHSYAAFMRGGKTAELTDAAKQADKSSHAELNKMRSLYSECADCTAKKPGWAVLPHGVFICIDCAQIHRSLGGTSRRRKLSIPGPTYGTVLSSRSCEMLAITLLKRRSLIAACHPSPRKMHQQARSS